MKPIQHCVPLCQEEEERPAFSCATGLLDRGAFNCDTPESTMQCPPYAALSISVLRLRAAPPGPRPPAAKPSRQRPGLRNVGPRESWYASISATASSNGGIHGGN